MVNQNSNTYKFNLTFQNGLIKELIFNDSGIIILAIFLLIKLMFK